MITHVYIRMIKLTRQYNYKYDHSYDFYKYQELS